MILYNKQHFHVPGLHIYARYRGDITILNSKLVALQKCTVEFRQPRLHTHDGIQNLPIEVENLFSL